MHLTLGLSSSFPPMAKADMYTVAAYWFQRSRAEQQVPALWMDHFFPRFLALPLENSNQATAWGFAQIQLQHSPSTTCRVESCTTATMVFRLVLVPTTTPKVKTGPLEARPRWLLPRKALSRSIPTATLHREKLQWLATLLPAFLPADY
jgi:hypothetical protein